MFEDIFHRRKLNINNLLNYGFELQCDHWVYNTSIMNDTFSLHISVMTNGNIDTVSNEKDTDEPYVLSKNNSSGTFVGEVRSAIETVLMDIDDRWYDFAIFKTEQAVQIIDYVRDTYGDELEYLWQKFPDNAVWRRKDNQKWYGAILTVSGLKLGLPTNEFLEIIDLRLQKELMEKTIDNIRYFPGWHMNKNNWYTIILDGRVPTEEICARIDESYRLAKK